MSKKILHILDHERLPVVTFMQEMLQDIQDPHVLAVYVYLASLPEGFMQIEEKIKNHFGYEQKKLDFIFSEMLNKKLLTKKTLINRDGSIDTYYEINMGYSDYK